MSTRAFLAAVNVLLVWWMCAGAFAEDAKPPEFPNLTMRSLDGSRSVDLQRFRGRPVLITFWASWCGPCRVELPELEDLYGELAGKGFVLLTVNVDTSSLAAERFISSTGLRVPVYRLTPAEAANLGLDSLPTNVLLDREGIPALVQRGYTPDLASQIRRLVLDMTSANRGVEPPERG